MGLTYLTANFVVGPLFVAAVADGESSWHIIRREFIALLPNHIVLIALGTATIFAYHQIGILALGLFSIIVLVPQLLLPILLRPKPVGDLSFSAATRLYGTAIADELDFPAKAKATIAYAAYHIDSLDSPCYGGVIKSTPYERHFGIDPWSVIDDVIQVVLYYREHFDGTQPADAVTGGLGGDWIRIEGRVLAVAAFWADKTTGDGTWRVTHARALELMKERAGTQFDPRVVAAAAQVVQKERMGLTDNQPQLQQASLPSLRRLLQKHAGADGLAQERSRA